MKSYTLILTAAFSAFGVAPALAQDEPLWEKVRQISTLVGEMPATVSSDDEETTERVRFEPFQAAEDMFSRDDVVFLMRHGPTDWSKRDINDVAPTDCDNQRIMTPLGQEQMTEFAYTMAYNDVVPSQIVVSEWCRNQQTLDAMLQGFDRQDPTIRDEMPIQTDADLNLLLSLQGAPNTTNLKELITNWDGNPDRSGPLLIISHYTNIEELTQFRVLEGEMLVIDPKRDNRVLGYIRLASASPDEGHFADSLQSPLLDGGIATDLVTRYYAALATDSKTGLTDILADDWVSRGMSATVGDQEVTSYLEGIEIFSDGLSNFVYDFENTYIADETITVTGTITGIHSGEIYGVEATGKNVAFGAMAVHKISDGQIIESWQMEDRTSLIQQISE